MILRNISVYTLALRVRATRQFPAFFVFTLPTFSAKILILAYYQLSSALRFSSVVQNLPKAEYRTHITNNTPNPQSHTKMLLPFHFLPLSPVFFLSIHPSKALHTQPQQLPLADPDSDSSSPFTASFDKMVSSNLERWHTPGLAIGVVDGGEIFSKVGMKERKNELVY